ncbi:MAG TPA: methylenetetrahydrofolate reductase [Bacillota bacterium]|nr:methylenetetrahydrofolate reductase [Bacillota bacterium]
MGLKENLGNRFVVTTELGPTDGTDVQTTLNKVREYVYLDGFNIHDCPNARMRMNSVALTSIIQRETGIDGIPHFTCRDRSLLGTQADLLGAHALGIRFILPTTGDAPNHGPYESSGVYDLNTLKLIRLVKNMNQGLDANDKEFKGPTDFLVSATASPVATNMEAVYSRVAKKIEAGADFFQTQPVYDVEKAISFARRMREFKVPTILSIMPLKSLKQAEFIRDHVDGIEVPDEIIAKLKGGASGSQIACDFISQVYREIDGIHIMALGDVKSSNTIIDHAKSLTSETVKPL